VKANCLEEALASQAPPYAGVVSRFLDPPLDIKAAGFSSLEAITPNREAEISQKGVT
jgi:hypothetical protein